MKTLQQSLLITLFTLFLAGNSFAITSPETINAPINKECDCSKCDKGECDEECEKKCEGKKAEAKASSSDKEAHASSSGKKKHSCDHSKKKKGDCCAHAKARSKKGGCGHHK